MSSFLTICHATYNKDLYRYQIYDSIYIQYSVYLREQPSRKMNEKRGLIAKSGNQYPQFGSFLFQLLFL